MALLQRALYNFTRFLLTYLLRWNLASSRVEIPGSQKFHLAETAATPLSTPTLPSAPARPSPRDELGQYRPTGGDCVAGTGERCTLGNCRPKGVFLLVVRFSDVLFTSRELNRFFFFFRRQFRPNWTTPTRPHPPTRPEGQVPVGFGVQDGRCL